MTKQYRIHFKTKEQLLKYKARLESDFKNIDVREPLEGHELNFTLYVTATDSDFENARPSIGEFPKGEVQVLSS